MKTKDVRWKQRFQNFEKAYVRLKEAMEMEELTELERNGLIQRLIDGLDIRNELSHDYSGEKFERSEKKLREETYVALGKLHLFFVNEKNK